MFVEPATTAAAPLVLLLLATTIGKSLMFLFLHFFPQNYSRTVCLARHYFLVALCNLFDKAACIFSCIARRGGCFRTPPLSRAITRLYEPRSRDIVTLSVNRVES